MKPPLHGFAPDDFQILPEALLPLFPYIDPSWTVWECAEGSGYLTRALRDKGYNTIGSDILDGHDFLTWHPPSFDCIITNPPYSLKQRFLYRCYALGKPWALLLPLTTLETRTRQKLFSRHGVELILFDKRINFRQPINHGPRNREATDICQPG